MIGVLTVGAAAAAAAAAAFGKMVDELSLRPLAHPSAYQKGKYGKRRYPSNGGSYGPPYSGGASVNRARRGKLLIKGVRP